ncbi:unnamed protein product [Amoebophrya sp. A120]|nr:unnamed protein product [Amoebophrya sp. A120]|eukprot:GSA120T00010052001.1
MDLLLRLDLFARVSCRLRLSRLRHSHSRSYSCRNLRKDRKPLSSSRYRRVIPLSKEATMRGLKGCRWTSLNNNNNSRLPVLARVSGGTRLFRRAASWWRKRLRSRANKGAPRSCRTGGEKRGTRNGKKLQGRPATSTIISSFVETIAEPETNHLDEAVAPGPDATPAGAVSSFVETIAGADGNPAAEKLPSSLQTTEESKFLAPRKEAVASHLWSFFLDDSAKAGADHAVPSADDENDEPHDSTA